MGFKFKKHYTTEEAQDLIPQLRQWLQELQRLREAVSQADTRLTQLLGTGNDPGGDLVNNWIRDLCGIRRLLALFQSREIQIKDLERGLLDFPALMGGREVFLCWEADEDRIEYWHDLETGYTGREKLPEA